MTAILTWEYRMRFGGYKRECGGRPPSDGPPQIHPVGGCLLCLDVRLQACGLWKGSELQSHQKSLGSAPWASGLIVFSQIIQTNLSYPQFWRGYSHPPCFWHLHLAADEKFALGEMRWSERHSRAFQLVKCWIIGFSVFPLDNINSINESPRYLWIEGFWPFNPCLFHKIIGY